MSILQRPKKYTIDVEGMQRVSVLGVIDPETGTRAYWEPGPAVEFLVDLQARPQFDAERYCSSCIAHDGELAILPHQLTLPKLRACHLRGMRVNPVGLPWQPGKPAEDVHLRTEHKLRPGRPMTLDACHMCLVSFLDEVERPPVPEAELRRLQASARAALDEVLRLRDSLSRETRPTVAAYCERLQEAARLRLRVAVRACWDAGVQPWRPRANRTGDEAPAEVVATTWVRPTDDGGPHWRHSEDVEA